jgi:hypothetical protein
MVIKGRAAYIDLDLRPVRVLYRWIIALNPFIVDKLGCMFVSHLASDGIMRDLGSPVKQLLPTPPAVKEKCQSLSQIAPLSGHWRIGDNTPAPSTTT